MSLPGLKTVKKFVAGVGKAISDSTKVSGKSASSVHFDKSYSKQLFNASTHCKNKAGTVTFDASAVINAGGSASVRVLVRFEYLSFVLFLKAFVFWCKMGNRAQ